MQILLLTSVVALVYSFAFKPFTEKSANHVDIFNECTLMAISYMTLSYTDYNDDPHLKYGIGWKMISIFFLNLITNICFILTKMLSPLFKKLKAKFKPKSLKSLSQQRKQQ